MVVSLRRSRNWELADKSWCQGRLTYDSRARVKVCAALIASLCNLGASRASKVPVQGSYSLL